MATKGGKQGTVPQGGFWGSQPAVYSQETQKLLKEMMRESKLTNFQQRQLTSRMKTGEALPTACGPTSSARPRKPAPQPRQESKIINPRTHSIEIRTLDQIEATGDLERPTYKPKIIKNIGEKDKERLSNIMAYGEDLKPRVKVKRAPPEPAPEVDRFDELVAEVEERKKFLDDMEALGRGKEYRQIIETEISQKVREMEVIDKKRSVALNRIIMEDEKRRRENDEKGIPKPTI